MKLGNNLQLLFIYCFLFSPHSVRNSIISTPLLNIEKLKPSYEDPDLKNDNQSNNKTIQKKKNF